MVLCWWSIHAQRKRPSSAVARDEFGRPSSFLAEDACQICYDACEVIDGVAAGRTSCGHLFHRGCLARWLQEAKVCGVCRSPCPSTLRMFAADEATRGDP